MGTANPKSGGLDVGFVFTKAAGREASSFQRKGKKKESGWED
jgi:hypothetical protein